MREVLDLATEKALRAYVSSADRAGVTLTARDEAHLLEISDAQYESQRSGAWE
jgi:hypothetical protein